jgi:hypothetical protein
MEKRRRGVSVAMSNVLQLASHRRPSSVRGGLVSRDSRARGKSNLAYPASSEAGREVTLSLSIFVENEERVQMVLNLSFQAPREQPFNPLTAAS